MNKSRTRKKGMGPLRMASLFSGIGGAEVALAQEPPLGVAVAHCEIDDKCARLLRAAFPQSISFGDVRALRALPAAVNLLVGGSPCQNLSVANTVTRDGLGGDKSRLFFEFVRLLREVPANGAFVFENVASMKKADKDAISAALSAVCAEKGWTLHCAEMDNSDFAPMRRRRLFWTNFRVPPSHSPRPDADVRDWMDPDVADGAHGTWPRARVENYMGGLWGNKPRWSGGLHLDLRKNTTKVGPCLTACAGKGIPYNLVVQADGVCRKWGLGELERLHGFPEGWTSPMGAYTHRIVGIGNTMSVFCMRRILSSASEFIEARI